MPEWRDLVPGRRGKLLLGLAAAVLAAAGGTYLILGQTRVDVTVGEGEAAVSREVACGNAFAGGRRADVGQTTATAPTTVPPDATGTTAPATTAPPDPATTEAADPEDLLAQAAEDAAIEDCAAAKRPRTIAGGILTAGGLGAVVILTQLLDSTRFTDT